MLVGVSLSRRASRGELIEACLEICDLEVGVLNVIACKTGGFECLSYFSFECSFICIFGQEMSG